jgi:hypothetical protein
MEHAGQVLFPSNHEISALSAAGRTRSEDVASVQAYPDSSLVINQLDNLSKISE